MTRSWATSRATSDSRKIAPRTVPGSAHRRDITPADAEATSAAGRSARSVASTDTMSEPPRACYRTPLLGVDAVDDHARRILTGLRTELLGERRDLQPF